MTAYKIEELKNENKVDWNNFCFLCNNAWYWHTVEFMEFIVASASSLVQNKSFLVYDNGVVVAVVPLLVFEKERIEGFPAKEIVYAGWATPYPAISSDLAGEETERLTRLVFDNIYARAIEEGVSRVVFSIQHQQEDLYSHCLKRNIMLNLPGFLDISECTQVVDLLSSLDELEKGWRKRFRRYIRSYSDKLDIEIVAAKNISLLHQKEFLDLRDKDSSQKWSAAKMPYLFGEVTAGRGIFIRCLLKESKDPVGYLFVLLYKGHAYDFAVAVNDEYKEMRISHAMKVATIRYLKSINVSKLYDLGTATIRPSMHRLGSNKQRAISYFKRGFASDIRTIFIAEKYFDHKYFRLMMEQRLRLLENDLFSRKVDVENEEKV
ncbi:hypothetical protein ACFL5U_00535 [Candidatus Margulisiibacteriota bacterium]